MSSGSRVRNALVVKESRAGERHVMVKARVIYKAPELPIVT